MGDMEWLKEIEYRAFEATDSETMLCAPTDCVKLIAAFKFAAKALARNYPAIGTLARKGWCLDMARLRSGDFGEGPCKPSPLDKNVGFDAAAVLSDSVARNILKPSEKGTECKPT